MSRSVAVLSVWFCVVAALADEPKAKVALDRYGDPIPHGAIARLGTARMRLHGQMRVLPDGKTLLVADDTAIRTVDLSDGRLIREVRLQLVDAVPGYSVLSPDGKLLVTPPYEHQLADKTIRVRNTSDGRQISSFPKGYGSICDGAVSNDGTRVAFAASFGKVRLWNATTGKEIREFEPDGSRVEFSSDGKLLAISGHSAIHLVEPDSGKTRTVIDVADERANCIALSGDARLLAAGIDGSVWVWSLPDGKLRHRIAAHKENVEVVRFSPDGAVLASGGLDRSIKLWDPRTGNQVGGLEGHEDAVCDLQFTPDGRQLVSEGMDIRRLWNLTTRKETLRFDAHEHQIIGLDWLDSERVITTAVDRSVRIWRAATGEPSARFASPGQGGFAVSSDGRMWAEQGDQCKVVVRLVVDGSKFREWPTGADWICGSVFSPDGTHLVCAARLGETSSSHHMFEIASGRSVAKLVPGDDPISGSIAFMPDGRNWVVGVYGTAVFRRRDGTVARRIKRNNSAFHELAVSPDGRFLVGYNNIDGNDGKVRLHEIASGGLIAAFPERMICGYCLRFSPDSRILVCAGTECGVRLWGTLSHKSIELAPRGGRNDRRAAFSPDGRRLAVSDRTEALVWDVASVRSAVESVPKAIEPGQGDRLWAELADADPGRAYQAIAALAAAGASGVEVIRRKMPAEVEPKIAELVARLDSDSFEVRQSASAQLEILSDETIEQLLSTKPAPEAAQRLRARLDWSEPSAGWLATVRAIAVLEHSTAPEAGALLAELAGGPRPLRRTAEAWAAWGRWKRFAK